jgi:hypothetical protein
MAKVSSPFAVSALPGTGTQYRLTSGGTGTPAASAYLQATRALAAWARTSGHAPLVHALVHLGWCSGSGARAICKASNSAAFKHAADVLEVGKPAGPQVVAVLLALTEAGAPAEQIATVWSTFTGSAA